ncbi:hypothetical protein [Metaclostridioides mangenotii]|uniref:Uncharacterized protein n=1 Tax=Metaclostridioides mangenotii TaxID=1540 RepID=A0ABS4E7Z5_9FIRM|nr:hypothetical protein [Clostridioides mangenotii]MBP1854060.1 hypothetical protein [Clostridioides mangenotii]
MSNEKIFMTIDLPNMELREISKGMGKIPKSSKVERKYNKNKYDI